MIARDSIRVASAAILLSVAIFTIGGWVAISLYPGGQPWDMSAKGYSFWHNTMSDLGLGYAKNGEPNPVGSRIYAASLMVIALAAGVLWACLPVVLGPGWLGATTRVLGLLSLAGAVGIAVTPGNLYPRGHVIAIGLAAVPTVLALCLTCVAVLRPCRRVPRVYAAATVLLLVLVLIHFGQYIAHFWLGHEWTVASPTVQKLAMLWATVWMSWTAILIGKGTRSTNSQACASCDSRSRT